MNDKTNDKNITSRALFSLLEERSASADLPMHMPGHKRSGGILRGLGRYDLTEAEGFDDLHAPRGIIADTEAIASRVWRSERAHLLVNGSTCGVLAAFYALCERGDRVIVARNCHKSVYHALELLDLDARYIMPCPHESGLFCGEVCADDIESAIEACEIEDKKPSVVMITSPTYEGVISDLGAISAVCRAHGVPLVVDSAHGAHLGVLSGFPESAIGAGADAAVVSLHKTLNSLTQTALILCAARYDGAIMHALDIFESSSPSYLLIASADECVRSLADPEKREEIASSWLSALKFCREKLSSLRVLRLIDVDEPSKLIIHAPIAGGGASLARLLKERDITLEASLPDYVIAMTGSGDSRETLARFADALLDIDRVLEQKCGVCPRRTALASPLSAPLASSFDAPPPRAMGICAALRADTALVPTDRASGAICAEYLTPYPPGVPLVIPGERLTDPLIALIRRSLPEKVSVLCVKE